MTKDETQRYGLPAHAAEKLPDVFRTHRKIRRVILYGSRAMGWERTGSDIDLCIEAEELNVPQLLSIESPIDDLLLPWKVDLTLRHKIDNPALLEHIDRVGVVFYKMSPG